MTCRGFAPHLHFKPQQTDGTPRVTGDWGEAAGGTAKADHAHPAPPALNLLCPPFSKASDGVLFLFFNICKHKENRFCLKMFFLQTKLKQFQCVSQGSGLLIACQCRQMKLRLLFITHVYLSNMSAGAGIQDGALVPVYYKSSKA